jgi:hypothetical protein
MKKKTVCIVEEVRINICGFNTNSEESGREAMPPSRLFYDCLFLFFDLEAECFEKLYG